MKCPHCGKEIESQQQKAARARWAKKTAKQKSEEMSKVRKKGIKNRSV
jgi:uncharacterized membrane protein YvbJ